MDLHARPPPTNADRAIIGLALVLPAVVTWVYFILLNGAPAVLQQAAYGIGKTVQFALPIAWVWLIQRERQALRRPSAWSLIVGALFGIVVAAATLGMYYYLLKPMGVLDEPSKAVVAKIKSFGASSLAAYLALAVFYSAFHSLLEEYYWRWFVFGQLSRICRLPTAIAISSLGFAAHHVLVLALYFGWLSPLTWLFTLAIVIGGAFWSWLYHKSDSLAATWLSHACIDAAIFATGYQMMAAQRL